MITVRQMTPDDAPACAAILNHIIALGGTTAHEDPFSDAGFATYYCRDADVALVAVQGSRILGFQACFETTPGVYSIGSFADQRDPVPGVGRALFAATRAACAALGGKAIIAKITQDNTPGLAYYSRMGFVDDRVVPGDHMRPNGQKVDRIIKRLDLMS